MPKRARKPKLQPRMQPWPAIILAVDTATNSGWSLWKHGKMLDSGAHKIANAGESYVDLANICRQALGHCEDARCLDGVLVLERPFGGSNSGTLMALGVAHRLWRDAWDCAGGGARRIVRVYPVTWRSKILGVTRGIEVRLRELEQAARFAHHLGDRQATPDEAAAICIGKWACHAGEVGRVLPKLRGKVQFQADRDERATAAIRRWRRKKAEART